MDTKAMAKSKRAHTQHHSKKPHKPKAPEKKLLQGNQTKTPVQSRLPSNWDRYDDELDPGDLLNQPADNDAIVAKSKGADYLHLISEALAESSHSMIDINLDSLDDDLLHDEFSRVVGSMISARGEGILSWMEDDNFVVVEEDGSASHHEPGFLSLDLNALEKMLEEVDVHERLYIDADLLPPDLRTSQSKVSRDKEPCRSHTSQDVESVTTTRLNELVVQQESSGKIDSVGDSPVLEAESLDQVKEIPILTEKSSAIEADLDLLLNSFSEEPNPLASASSQKIQRSSAFETELDSLLNSHVGSEEPLSKPANPSDQKLYTTGFGDVLDDLLESTLSSAKPQGNQTSSSSAVGKSKVSNEFDSWLDTI